MGPVLKRPVLCHEASGVSQGVGLAMGASPPGLPLAYVAWACSEGLLLPCRGLSCAAAPAVLPSPHPAVSEHGWKSICQISEVKCWHVNDTNSSEMKAGTLGLE